MTVVVSCTTKAKNKSVYDNLSVYPQKKSGEKKINYFAQNGASTSVLRLVRRATVAVFFVLLKRGSLVRAFPLVDKKGRVVKCRLLFVDDMGKGNPLGFTTSE